MFLIVLVKRWRGGWAFLVGEKGDTPVPKASKEGFRVWERQSPYFLNMK